MLILSFPSPSRVALSRLISPVYLPIARRRILRYISLSRVKALCEKQIALSRSWTWVTVSISYDDFFTTFLSRYFKKFKIWRSVFLYNHFCLVYIFMQNWIHLIFLSSNFLHLLCVELLLRCFSRICLHLFFEPSQVLQWQLGKLLRGSCQRARN